MAQAVYPNDEARFPAYPEPGGNPAQPVYRPNAAPVAHARSESNLALNNAAETVGEAVGSAVTTVKELPDRLQEMKERFTVIRGRAQQDIKTKAVDLADDLKEQAKRTAEQARTRAETISRQQPLAVILGAAAVGMLLGIFLRIWRDHAD